MSLRILMLGSIYPGNLQLFYAQNQSVKGLPYLEHAKRLLENSTEFIFNYTRTFNKLGYETSFICGNDILLQKKWQQENNLKTIKGQDLIYEQVKKYQPEILFIEDTQFIDKEWIKTIKEKIKSIRIVVAFNCAPYSSQILEKLKCFDLLITCTPGLKQEFENQGIKTYLVYHGFDTNWLAKISENNDLEERDLIFSGSLLPGHGYHKDRIELVEKILKENIDISLYVNLENIKKIRAKQCLYQINKLLNKLKLNKIKNYFPILEYGSSPTKNYSKALYHAKQKPVYGLEMYKTLAKSKIILNSHVDVAGNYAGNMRLFETTGIGSCLLTDKKINLPELFEPDYEVVVYENNEDCLAKLKWLLDNETERKKIAKAGQKRTLSSHTVENRCKQMIEIFTMEMEHKK